MPQIDLTLPDDIDSTVERALAEDIGDGDRNAPVRQRRRSRKHRAARRSPSWASG